MPRIATETQPFQNEELDDQVVLRGGVDDRRRPGTQPENNRVDFGISGVCIEFCLIFPTVVVSLTVNNSFRFLNPPLIRAWRRPNEDGVNISYISSWQNSVVHICIEDQKEDFKIDACTEEANVVAQRGRQKCYDLLGTRFLHLSMFVLVNNNPIAATVIKVCSFFICPIA